MDNERMNKVVLTTTGCYGTGSSAVTDLMREFDCVDCKGEYEVRFIHDPDGISDLEYNIVENPNRHNSSNSIKRFVKMMEDLDHIWFIKRYHKQFGDAFLRLMYEYIDNITVCKYKGAWHYDVYERGKLFYILSRTFVNINMGLNNYLHIPLIHGNDLISKNECAYLPLIDEKDFLKVTQCFIGKFVTSISDVRKKYVFLDQLVPPSNFNRYIRYIKRIKIILVERDPRDIYIMEKYIWKGRVAPAYNIEKYCEWYKWTRDLYRKDKISDAVLIVQFEDLIYQYEKTVNSIMEHFGLEKKSHSQPFKYFNPKISINNTQSWILFPSETENIKKIENKLKDYCYEFPCIRTENKKTRMF